MKKHRLLSISSIALLALVLLSLWSCEKRPAIVQRNWQLVWEDNFDASNTLDPAKWRYDLGIGPNNDGWGNAELQSYTDKPENVKLEDGNLVITAIRNGNTFTSARIKTQGLFEHDYGRFEARIKLPYGPGVWPAFWMLGADIADNPWPSCGEIDIVEGKGQQPNVIHGTIHGPGYSSDSGISSSFGFENARFDTDFHIFAVEWTTDGIDFYVDDTMYKRITPNDVPGVWVYNHPFFIILNVAVGGNFVGFPTSDTPFPQSMYVDYVKVYKEVK